ncbi:MAG: ATP-binding protein [Gracilimonas sp.]|uniref:ATP-binding protein n=1 Tax=Gracilimonas sp. TaxID=1974203 RepID=UPI0019B7133E|nr:ATP-binding protein [Gracilimonas sp.]MBD3617446.1 ATP-binding protein [Gracilimonas sp.]
MFTKATRKGSHIKLAITGPSGSGKTYSALRLAGGLMPNGKIALIDTENESASLYANDFEFDVSSAEAPYTIDKLVNPVKEALSQDYDVLIVDSASHFWNGILEYKDKLDKRGGNHFGNWAEANKQYDLFLRAILFSKIHVIVCMRSKMEYVIQENEKGKQIPQKVGMAPIMRDGVEYEFTAVFDLDMHHQAQTSKDRTNLFGEKIFQITEQTGVLLRDWLNESSGASETQREEPPIPEEVFFEHHE